MDRAVLRAFDREIVEQGPRLVFRKRASGAFVMAALTGVVAAALYGLGQWLRPADGESGVNNLLVSGAAGLLAIVAVLALLGAVYLLFMPSRRVFAEVDAAGKTMVIRRRQLSFREIRQFSFTALQNGMQALCVETGGGETIPVWVATASQRDPLRALAARLNALREGEGPSEAGATVATGVAAAATPFEQRLRTQIIVAMGVVWTLGGYVFFRGLSFTSRLDPDGLQIPVWCAGLIILAFGGIDWLRSRRR